MDKSDVYEALISNRLERGDREAVRKALIFAERGKARAFAERVLPWEAALERTLAVYRKVLG